MNAYYQLCIKSLVVFTPVFINEVYAAETAILPDQNTIGGVGQLLSLVTGLIIVLAAFLFLAYLFKKFSGPYTNKIGHMQVIDALPLSTREKLVLVKVVDVHMVLGIASGNISALHVMTGQLPEQDDQSVPYLKSRFQEIFAAHKTKSG